ncbi:MAG TPA: hypothetical protein VLB84_15775 [Bacteroidia bacterium]|nr:hypothetical protein [Bacteroidia bacterium]
MGKPPHRGTQKILAQHGVPLNVEKRARQINWRDMEHYDYIVALDSENVTDLRSHPKVKRLMEYAPSARRLDVPDPYYTGQFDLVYEMVVAGCKGLLETIRRNEGL